MKVFLIVILFSTCQADSEHCFERRLLAYEFDSAKACSQFLETVKTGKRAEMRRSNGDSLELEITENPQDYAAYCAAQIN